MCCPHVGCWDNAFRLAPPTRVTRSDGSTFDTDFVCCCTPCLMAAGGDVEKVLFTRDAVFTGNAPGDLNWS